MAGDLFQFKSHLVETKVYEMAFVFHSFLDNGEIMGKYPGADIVDTPGLSARV